MSSLIDPSEIIIQEMIEGGPKNLYSYACFFGGEKSIGSICAKRSRQHPMDFGQASTYAESVHIPELYEMGNRILKKMGYFGIAMSFIHVHVNRSPIEGKVLKIRRVPGEFNSLKHLNPLLENERVFTQINSKNLKIGIVQIASRLVRRIESYKEENDNVAIGERIGIIKFGSQVDLLIYNPDVKINTKLGDEVKAGLSILAEY